jgi:ABC-type tungstate transport system permease subunit
MLAVNGSLASAAESKDVILSTTTSTADSGLLDVLIPLFEKKTGFLVKTISVGTGQALAMGEKGEADVMLVHAPASEKAGYTLTDRATYLAQKANIKLEILSEGDKPQLNIYHVMQVNPEKFSKVNAAGAKAFVEFMIAPETQKVIGDFGKDKYGAPLFFPDAVK